MFEGANKGDGGVGDEETRGVENRIVFIFVSAV
jgi:hypothetical protein